jgi:hypothetical protein
MDENLSYNDITETIEPEIPKQWEIWKNREEEVLYNNEFLEKLKEKLLFQDDTNEHIFRTYQPKDYQILKGFLFDIDENILGISNIEAITADPDRTMLFAYYIYDILFHDLPEIYLPKISQKYKLSNYNVFYNMESNKFREYLFTVLHDIITILNLEKENNPELMKEKFKISISLDLFDNDLEDFYEEFVLKIISQL